MKKGSVQLCFILVAITGIHTVKIMRNSPERGRVLPLKNIKSEIMLSGQDSLSTTADNRPVERPNRRNIWEPFTNWNANKVFFQRSKSVDAADKVLGRT